MLAWRVLLAVLLGVLAWSPMQPVRAQGFFQQYFGARQMPLPPPRPRYPGSRFDPYPSYGEGSFGDGTYRTLCVRLCDGYYFPISFSTTRSEFTRDAEKCQASCGSGARLYYYPNPGGELESMVDLTGMGYASLPTAFKYRKTLVNGCACQPQTWTQAETQPQKPDADEPAPGGSTGGTRNQPAVAGGEPLAIVRPAPVSRYVQPGPSQLTYSPGLQRNPVAPKQGSPGGFFR